MSAVKNNDSKSLTADDVKPKSLISEESPDSKLSKSLSNLRGDTLKPTEYVNHPNSVPDFGSIGQVESADQKSRNRAQSLDNCDPKGKPPIGSSTVQSESCGNRSKPPGNRTNAESHDQRNRGSIGSCGSCDSRTNEEEVVITYQDEAVDITEQGGGNEVPTLAAPRRAVIISSKMRNTTAIRHALQPNVVFVPYKYENSTLDGLRELVSQGLGEKRCESVALILSCSGLSLQLCGKEEKLQVLTKENLADDQPVRKFFTSLVANHVDQSKPGARLDFLACNLMLHTDGAGIDKELENCIGIGVRLYKDLAGSEVVNKKDGDQETARIPTVGEQYFKLDKLRGWSGQQQQTLAGFEKIQTVGKGAYGAAVLYKKKDDDSLVILKEINMHDLKASERQMALNEVNILAMLEHPNIISYFDSFEEDGVIMIEMEYADGGTLAKFLAVQEKPLEEKEIMSMFQQIVAAIRHIHEHNVLHRYPHHTKPLGPGVNPEYRFTIECENPSESRTFSEMFISMGPDLVPADLTTPNHLSPCEPQSMDSPLSVKIKDLKTANIFLTKEGVVKVGDFGISKMMSTANKAANTVLGTPYYISPEMCEGKPYNDRSDIWALGCILYEMACLQKTFEGSNLPALVNKIMKGQFAPVKGNYCQEFKDLIMEMLQQDPTKRPSANELMYLCLPKLLSKYVETSDCDEDLTTSTSQKKKTRTVLYYFDSATAMLTPIELPPKIRIRTTAVGADHLIVVTSESQVFTWGDGRHGQLGHGDTVSRGKPELVAALTGKSITRACCGDGFSVFSSDRGIVLTCGDGSKGCLGHADWSAVYRPRLIETLLSVDVIAVACGTSHVVVVGSDGEVFAWGGGSDGKLGLGHEDNQCQPAKVAVSEPVIIRDVFCGLDGTMLLTDVGSVFACGSNRDNKLGLNNRHGFIMAMRNIFTRTEVEGQKVATLVRSLSRHKVVDISMGPHHTAVIIEAGVIYTFGRNIEGQLGIEGTKPANAPVEVKTMPKDSNVNRAQCGEHYTVAGTNQNELYYWGLRFKAPGPRSVDGSESNNDSTANRDDLRVESVTPRNAAHSRQASVTSTLSIESIKEQPPQQFDDGLRVGEGDPNSGSHQRQSSVDSSVSGHADSGYTGDTAATTDMATRSGTRPLRPGVGEGDPNIRSSERQSSVDSSVYGQADSGYTGDTAATSDMATRSGFRPLSSVPRRSASASSRENAKEKDPAQDDSEIIFPPNHLMKILPSEESLVLSSFFCHGENIFVQLETTAPPPRRRSRKKRGIRKRYSGNTLPVPDGDGNQATSASSREGGDEYSSEASEMDTHGVVPYWIRQELAMSEVEANDGNEADDTDNQSDDDLKPSTIDTSMSSIQINRDLTPCKLVDKVSPRVLAMLKHDPSKPAPSKSGVSRGARVRSFSNNSTESEVDNSNHSDSSCKDNRTTSEEQSRADFTSRRLTSGRISGPQPGYMGKSTVISGPRVTSRLRVQTRGYVGQNLALKEQLAARGFVSDVTVKRREEALLGELHMTRSEKRAAERRLQELEEDHTRQQEKLRADAEQRSLEREQQLQEQISSLRAELQTQNCQLRDNQQVVVSLQEQLCKVEKKKKRYGGLRRASGAGTGTSSDSKVCSLQ